ncbi:MAG: hypothetical protein JNK14_20740 [Chitinophagaceae bacterium]|nr:hypothetical protein [Chitinophagaceae bacterium]
MRLLIIITCLVLAGCSANVVLKAKEPGKFFDNYFILKDKRYSYYTKVIFCQRQVYGHYALSQDTIYLLRKRKKLYYMTGYALLNQDTSSIVVYGLDTTGSKLFNILYFNK